MAWNGEDFEQRLKTAADAFDRAEAARLCDELIAHLDRSDDVYEEKPAKRILGILRRKCWFDLLQRAADAFLRADQTAFQIRRQYAQSMIDQGNLTAAVITLEALEAAAANDPEESAEARGLLGRVRKQQYVNAGEPGSQRNQRNLKQAIAAYYAVYQEDKSRLWHGINAVALLARARRDGVEIEGFPTPEVLAEEILAVLTDRAKAGPLEAWDLATAAEAAVALGRDAEALGWIVKYVNSEGTDAFELSSTLRQLQEIWGLKDDKEPGASLLPVLRSQLLRRQGGGVSVQATGVKEAIQDAAKAAGSKQLQKILGATGMETLRWYKTGLERSLAVAKIETETEAVGTGFIVKGKHFHDAFGEELLLLTNAHVVSNDPKVQKALRPDEAVVRFESLDNWSCGVAELLWTSSPDDLDATLLRLEEQPAGCKPFPVAPALPLADGLQRLYIIGHPGGRELSISLNDNLLLDWQDPWLHYRTPTEGGSSGSPVFNHDWKLIGLHHAGDLNMRKLNGKEGTYAANEGIWIQTILKRFKAEWTPPAAPGA
ncbi:MAG TPA: serine protease [Thermoanaerobaculia bacterium]|nr:serine protease [Thermoanaerobaculia bacterium]